MKKVAIKMTEHQLQSSIFSYVNKVLPALRPFIFAIPNGGARDIRVARKLKTEGVTAGVWDIFVSLPNHYKHGLYIECKVGKNDLTSSQDAFHRLIKKVGYEFAICRSIDDFIVILEDYLELEKLSNKEIISRIKCEEFVQKVFEDRELC